MMLNNEHVEGSNSSVDTNFIFSASNLYSSTLNLESIIEETKALIIQKFTDLLYYDNALISLISTAMLK